jgi:hypothetical protein
VTSVAIYFDDLFKRESKYVSSVREIEMPTNFFAATIAAIALGATGALAGPVDISGLVNANLKDVTDYNTDVGLYPSGGSTVTINGVNFTLASFPGAANSLGVVQSPGVPVPGTGPGSGFSSYTFDVDLPNVSTVYTLINSVQGAVGEQVGYVTFEDSGGDSKTFYLTEGTNLRDWDYNIYNNAAPGVFGTANWGVCAGPNTCVRLDAQQFVLPAAFDASTLRSITFGSTANASFANGDPFLAAITATSGVPEPSAWLMMLVGFAGLGFAGYQRQRDAKLMQT